MRPSAHQSVMVASLVAICGIARGQNPEPTEPTADRPRIWVWGPDGVPCNVTPSTSDFQTATLVLDSQPGENGTQAAQRIAAYIIQHTRTSTWSPLNWLPSQCTWGGIAHEPDLSPQVGNTGWTNTICVSIKEFGAAVSNRIVQTPLGPRDYTLSQFPFYRETDRFRDYKLGSYSTANGSFGFPSGGGENYRHPFIENAIGANPPLRAWMCDFLREYRRLQGPGNPFLPDISRFFMDTEVNDFVSPGELRELWSTSSYAPYSHNDVWMLEQIYDSRKPEHRQIDPNYLDYWSTVPVPGEHVVSGVCAPAFCTLKDIYLRDAEAFGLPIHASGPEAGLPDLSGLTSRELPPISTTVPASDNRNRNILLW